MIKGAVGSVATFNYLAKNGSGNPVTGKAIGDFTATLARESSPGAWVGASETVTCVELSSLWAAGTYAFQFTPANAAKYVLTIIPTFAGTDGRRESEEFDIAATLSSDLTNYCTRDQVKLLIGGFTDASSNPITTWDALIDELILQAKGAIDSFCRRDFGSSERTEYPRGGARQIVLRAFPVQSITSIHECTDVPRVYDATTVLTTSDYVADLDRGIIERVGTWANGTRAIRVIYQGGPASVPADVNRAAVKLVAHWFQQRQFIGISSVAAPEGSTTRLETSGFPADVAALLGPYRDFGVL